MQTVVVNIYKEQFDIYIGRAGRGQDGYFGNPFRIGHGVSREDAVERFQRYFADRIEKDSEFKRRILALKGKRLGCFCKPKACHGDVIADWLNKMEAKGGGLMIEVYIDGSSKGNPGPGGAGIVIQDKATQETLGIHGIPLGYVTNNQAEFFALKHALIELKTQRLSHEPVNILTDSQLVVGIFSQNWKAKANLELVMEIRDLLKEFPQLTFAYVRGHNGNQGNELADSLAQEAAESQKGIKSQ